MLSSSQKLPRQANKNPADTKGDWKSSAAEYDVALRDVSRFALNRLDIPSEGKTAPDEQEAQRHPQSFMRGFALLDEQSSSADVDSYYGWADSNEFASVYDISGVTITGHSVALKGTPLSKARRILISAAFDNLLENGRPVQIDRASAAWHAFNRPTLDWFGKLSSSPDLADRAKKQYAYQQALQHDILFGYEKFSSPNWDGHGAEPITTATLMNARQLISQLPSKLGAPEASPGLDGSIALEWHSDKYTILHKLFLDIGPDVEWRAYWKLKDGTFGRHPSQNFDARSELKAIFDQLD